jgi:hypothetical protein
MHVGARVRGGAPLLGAWGYRGTPARLSLFDNTALFVIDLLAIPLCVIGALLALTLV